MTIANEVMELFATRGQDAYFGEELSILEHSLQTAWLAREADSADNLMVAALVHDIGHLLHGMSEDIAAHGFDGRHEAIGAEWLRIRFGPAVSEPVRLHVDAKRYLCRVEPEYRTKLSASSIQSLELQGGPLDDDEVREFELNPWFRDAVALRHWDDLAKDPGLRVPGLGAYVDLLR